MLSSKDSVKFPGRRSFLALLISAGLWVMNAFSAGFFEYYKYSLYSVIDGVKRKVLFAVWTGNLHTFMELSGFYWFPTYHFGISLPIFPVIFTIYLSYAIFLTLRDMFTGTRQANKKEHLIKISFSFFASTITTGACCTFPIIYFAIAIFVSASSSLAFDVYLGEVSYLIDAVNGSFLIWLHLRNKSSRETKLSFNL